ncbi:pkd domain-containing protein [Chrysochromulina tobinii]|uniref:Pkd domain-containing protein n=1 Tax=Chrysochromulina tobinii TaxID=1460289 RepID=A0A0M0J6A7_9EUKA|nr:pkd domain-containing protein [Chrysochromulina tobinii]|eukprot:KOO21965.1 pkd domain-containing protein [Chrysochromulina sp. CCMP291]
MSVPDPLMSVAPPPPFIIEPMLPPRAKPPKLAPTSHEWAVQAGGGSSLFGSKSLLSRGGEDAFVMHVTASGDIDWAVQAGGTGINDEARSSGIAHDGAGGAFVTGVFSGTASFGDTSLTSRGSFDAFVLHVTASGLIDWAVQAGGASYDQGFGIAHDGTNGGAFVTGTFAGEAHFGSYAVTSRGVYAVFVMHVTASGVIDWVVQAGGKGTDNVGRGIAHDGSGGALVTGTFDGSASQPCFSSTSSACHAWFGSTTLTTHGDLDTFVMHVTASGAIDWAVTAGTSALDWECIFCEVYVLGVGIAHDGAGGALVTGAFKGEAFFGSKSLKSRGIYDDVFVMHVTASGAVDWAVQAGGASYDQGNGIAHDGANGGAFVTGCFAGEAHFGSYAVTSRGVHSVFVMHVTASGVIDWVVQAGGMGTDNFGRGIAHDGSGGALVTGTFDGSASQPCFSSTSSACQAWFGSTTLATHGDLDTFVMHVTASGVIDWAVTAGTSTLDWECILCEVYVLGVGIAHDGAGGALVTGAFKGEAFFGSKSLKSRGGIYDDVFVMHVTASGAIDWAVQAGGASYDQGNGIAHDGAGGAFVTGDFMGEASFGSMSLVSLGGSDAFVMHVTSSGAIDWAVQLGGAAVAPPFDVAYGIAYDDTLEAEEVPSDVVSSNWAVEVEGTASSSGNGIAHDGAGGAFVTGVFSGTASFGDTSLTSRGSFDVFVLHVTASGLIDWAVQAGGASYDYDQGYGIAHDGANGGAFVTGTFAGEAHFGSYAVTSRGVYALNLGGSNTFVMHVTASGIIDWAVRAGSSDAGDQAFGYEGSGRGIAYDGTGGAFVTGHFRGEALFGSTSFEVSSGVSILLVGAALAFTAAVLFALMLW